MKCPYCNLDMGTVEMDLGTDTDVYTCTNEKCLPEIFVPHGIVTMGIGANIKMVQEIDKKIASMNDKVFTKHRDGYKHGIMDAGKMILSVLNQQGMIIKDGQFVMLDPLPEKKLII